MEGLATSPMAPAVVCIYFDSRITSLPWHDITSYDYPTGRILRVEDANFLVMFHILMSHGYEVSE